MANESVIPPSVMAIDLYHFFWLWLWKNGKIIIIIASANTFLGFHLIISAKSNT